MQSYFYNEIISYVVLQFKLFALAPKNKWRAQTYTKRECQKFCYLIFYKIFKINRLGKGFPPGIREGKLGIIFCATSLYFKFKLFGAPDTPN